MGLAWLGGLGPATSPGWVVLTGGRPCVRPAGARSLPPPCSLISPELLAGAAGPPVLAPGRESACQADVTVIRTPSLRFSKPVTCIVDRGESLCSGFTCVAPRKGRAGPVTRAGPGAPAAGTSLPSQAGVTRQKPSLFLLFGSPLLWAFAPPSALIPAEPPHPPHWGVRGSDRACRPFEPVTPGCTVHSCFSLTDI